MTFGLSCIVPAFNEAPRIAAVLTALQSHPGIEEVIVVDDGSTDATAAIVAGFAGVRLIRLPQNRGKTWAVSVGIEAARHSHLLLVDSDLLGLGTEALEALIAPVRAGHADVSVSLRGNAPRLWRRIGLDYISGERVLPRALVGAPEALRRLPRFGLEVHLNRQLIAAGHRLAVVPWPEVQSPWKSAKHGWWAGLQADLAMLADMFRTVPLHRALGQIVAMRRLRA